MKKLLLSVLMIFTIALTACSSTSSTSTQVGLTQTENGLPTATQLVLGSLKLEDTTNSITSEQATELLPMWQVYEELLGSDTAAQEEIDALTEQIQETMTSDQMQAITDMQLTQQDMFTAMQGASTVTTSTSQSSSNITIPSGGGAAGGPPDGGGGGGGGTPPDMGGGGMPSDFSGAAPSDMGTGSTQNTQTTSSQAQTTSAPTVLVQLLIQTLQQKVAA